MFSAGARRSSLRPKTPGRTPGPSRFSVGRSSEWATHGGVPRRFTDSETPRDQAFARSGAEETHQADLSENGNADLGRGLSSRQNAEPASGTFGGNGFASPRDDTILRPVNGEQSARRIVSEHAEVLQSTETAATTLPPRNVPFESPGVGALATRAPATDAALGSIRQRTAVDEGRAVVVAPTQGNEEEVWRRFRGAGTLDEDVLVRKEKEDLRRRLEEVQRELADYRYNLGVLILEHKNCSPRIEELDDALQRTQEELHNEGRSLRVALEDAARREDGLRGSLKVERAAIADLTQSLKEMHAKLEAAEATSRERLAKADQLEAKLSQERKHVEALAKKASRDLKAAQELEAGVKVRESEVDGKMRAMQEREQDVATREEMLRKGQEELRVAEGEVREKEFALADVRKSAEKELEGGRKRLADLRKSVERELEEGNKKLEEELEREKQRLKEELNVGRKSLKEELERGRKEIEQARRDGEKRIEALRLSVEEEREKMRGEVREAKEATEEALSAREKELKAKEENAANKAETLQALLKEAEDKQDALSVRQHELEEREKLLGEEKHRMLLKEADLLDQEGNLAEERARLTEQETEWQRIESKLETRATELDARATILLAREAEAEIAFQTATAEEAFVQQREKTAREKEAELQVQQESMAALQRDFDANAEAMELGKADLQKEKQAVERKEAEAALERQQLQTHLEELANKEAGLVEYERRLKVRGLELSTKEQTLAAREQQVALRESGTEKDLQERWEALEAKQRETEADLAKQLKQLQAEKAKEETSLKNARAQIDEERQAVHRELQETRTALETEFQTKVLKIQERLGQKLMVTETERQKAVESEVEKRVKDLTEGFEVKLEEKLALKLAERFAGVDGEVEKRVGELVKERVKGLEERQESEVERRVKEAVRKEVEGQVKARVKEAVQKTKEETTAKVEREKEAGIQKALKAAEKKAEDERKVAVASAKDEAWKQFEQETGRAVEKALKAAEIRTEDERKAAVASAKEEARKQFEQETERAVQNALKAAEKESEGATEAAVASAMDEAQSQFELATEIAVQKALAEAEKKAVEAKESAIASAKEEARMEKELAIQRALDEMEGKTENERKAAVARVREEAKVRLEKQKDDAIRKALLDLERERTAVMAEAESERTAAVAKAIEEARTKFEQEKETAVRVAVREAESKMERERKAAVASVREEARASFEQEKADTVRKAVESTEKKAEKEKKAAIAAAVEDAVKAEGTRLAGKERAADEERRESEGGPDELGNGGQEDRSRSAPVEEAPKRSWLGMLSPRRPIRIPQPAPEIVAVRLEDANLPIGPVEPTLDSVNPINEEPVPTEPGPPETAGVNALETPKTSKPPGKRKLLELSSGERPAKQRRAGRRKDDKLGASETETAKGPVEALGAAVTAVGRTADAVTGPFGFVLDDADLGFEPGSTETQAERDQSVKKPSWSLWPGFLSPRKSKPSKENQGGTGSALEERPLPEGGAEPSTVPAPQNGEGAEIAVTGGQNEGQSTPSLVAVAEQNGGQKQLLASALHGTTSEIDLRSSESEPAGEIRPSLVAKTPKRSGGQTPKPSRTPKPFPPAVRASSRLRERALSSELSGSLELPAASQLLPLAEAPGRGSPSEGRNGMEPDDVSPSLRAHRSLTPEEQAKLDRLLESFQAEEQAIAHEEAVLNPPSPAVLKPPTTVEALLPQISEPLAVPGSLPGSLTPETLTPGLESADGELAPITAQLTPEPLGPSPANLQSFGAPGLGGGMNVVKRKSGDGRSVERLRKGDLLRAKAAKASGRTSETFLSKAEMAKDQDLPEDDIEETTVVPPGGASPAVDAEPIEGSLVSDSPPARKSTLPPKTPKSIVGRAYENLMAAFGSPRDPAREERQEGSLEGNGEPIKSQVKELRGIVDDLVGAADRDEEMGGPEGEESDPPEGEELSEGGPERLEFGTPEGSERDLGFAHGGSLEQGGCMSVAQSALQTGEAVFGAAVTDAQEVGGALLKKTRVREFDLNEKAAEIADEMVGVPAADVADDVIVLGAAAGQLADALTGNIGEALAAEGLHTGAGAGEGLVGKGPGTLEGANDAGGAGLRSEISREPTPSYGTAIEGGGVGRSGPARGVKSGAKAGGGNEVQSLQRRGSKRKAAQIESKGKQVKETKAEAGDEGASKHTRVKRRVKETESGDNPELVDPRVVDFALKFDGGEELEADGSETGRRRKRSKSVLDPRDGEDVTAGLRRYNLRKSTLVKMHVWEPRGADFDTGADNDGIHTRTGVASTPRNLRRSVFDGDNPFLEDVAPGNPHSLEEIRTPRSARGGRGGGGTAAPQDDETEQANAGWRWLGFLGW